MKGQRRLAQTLFPGIVGGRIIAVRWLQPNELAAFGFGDREDVPCLILDNGLAVVALRDPEGNGGGWFEVTGQER